MPIAAQIKFKCMPKTKTYLQNIKWYLSYNCTIVYKKKQTDEVNSAQPT